MKTKVWMLFSVFFAILAIASMALATDFPGREEPKYQEVPYIEIDELYQDYSNGNVIIVDVRSELEYDTIHIDGAVYIPVGSQAFESEVTKLAEDHPGKKIGFY